MASEPAASFLLIIDEVIRPRFPTVAVTSLRAYIFLSAGATWAVCPTTAMPVSFTCFINSSGSSDVLKPLIDSSLSTVPPVNPSPLPLILATGTPQAAVSGPTTIVVLSPTPPVECLSTLMPLIDDRSTTSPENFIAFVREYISSLSRPLIYAAIRNAAA